MAQQKGRGGRSSKPDATKVLREDLKKCHEAAVGKDDKIMSLLVKVQERDEKIREDAELIQRVRDAEEAAADLRQRLATATAERIKAEGAKGRKDAKLAETGKRLLKQLQELQGIARTIHIIFDGPPGNESGRFVEVEDSKGRGMNVGEWVERKDGYWALVLQVPEGETIKSARTAEVVFGLQTSQEALRVESGRLRLQLQTVTEERDTARQERSRATVSEERAVREIGEMKCAEEERLAGLEVEKATVPDDGKKEEVES